MLEELRKAFMEVRSEPSYEDKKIVMRLTYYINQSPRNLKEQKLLDECVSETLKIVGRNFVKEEIMKMSDIKVADWLNQFKTEELTVMMYDLKNKLVV